jgi:dTDP-4-amino-4,6-dideoxygalactose transaminase
MIIPFNKPFLSGNELEYIKQAVQSGKISGDGIFSKRCHKFFEERFKFKKILLTTSCTDALEMTAILTDIMPGDEVIMPSYTFVSTANAFVLRGASIAFCDSRKDNPNIDENRIEELITTKTKAIVCVHYGGIACEMDKIIEIASKHNLFIIEDAAQAIDSYYNGIPLGSIGNFGAFSFHETKNVISGEGGMLAVNDEKFIKRAEIIREKGTNRSAYFRGEVDKYGWIDIGSSFLPSELISAFLFAQLENLDQIQEKRKLIWNLYFESLKNIADEGFIKIPYIPPYATNNGHLFFIVCKTPKDRENLIAYLMKNGINAVFHYLSLHKSLFYKDKHHGGELQNSDYYSDCLVRLPLYKDLEESEVYYIVDLVNKFFRN